MKNHKSFRHLRAKFEVTCSFRSPDNGLVSDQGISNFLFSIQIYYKLKLLLLLNPKSYWLETWASYHSWQKKSAHVKKNPKTTSCRQYMTSWPSSSFLPSLEPSGSPYFFWMRKLFTQNLSWFWKLALFSTIFEHNTGTIFIE